MAQAAIQGDGFETLTSLEGGLVNMTSHIAADTQVHADFTGVDDMGTCDTEAHLADIAALGDRCIGMVNGVVGPHGALRHESLSAYLGSGDKFKYYRTTPSFIFVTTRAAQQPRTDPLYAWETDLQVFVNTSFICECHYPHAASLCILSTVHA